ncbi:conserved domain protein [Parvimonas sp. oral taxon 393 str. F0440]|nr:conserved domain protein [Parvimonas sp. oral taxon 393 str. F0440]
MNESIENTNVSNPEIKTKRFNLKSLILVINYFITPILIMVIFFLLLENMKFVETVMNLPIVYNFFQNNKHLIESEDMFNDFLTSVISSIATLITFIITVFLSKKEMTVYQ